MFQYFVCKSLKYLYIIVLFSRCLGNARYRILQGKILTEEKINNHLLPHHFICFVRSSIFSFSGNKEVLLLPNPKKKERNGVANWFWRYGYVNKEKQKSLKLQKLKAPLLCYVCPILLSFNLHCTNCIYRKQCKGLTRDQLLVSP